LQCRAAWDRAKGTGAAARAIGVARGGLGAYPSTGVEKIFHQVFTVYELEIGANIGMQSKFTSSAIIGGYNF